MPACQTNFITRLRVLKHVCDKRRTKCSKRILSGEFPTVSKEALVFLEDADRASKRAAKRGGHTSVPALGQAKRADGRKIGRAQL